MNPLTTFKVGFFKAWCFNSSVSFHVFYVNFEPKSGNTHHPVYVHFTVLIRLTLIWMSKGVVSDSNYREYRIITGSLLHVYARKTLYLFLKSVEKLRKTTISFVLSVRLLLSCLSVCPHGTTRLPLDEFFNETYQLRIFQNLSRNFKFN
jgi:hypothetical protein